MCVMPWNTTCGKAERVAPQLGRGGRAGCLSGHREDPLVAQPVSYHYERRIYDVKSFHLGARNGSAGIVLRDELRNRLATRESRTGVTTIQDVARAAGVAASTVSRYLNGQLRVSPATEAKVLEAVSELGYVPNAAGRGTWPGAASGVIGFVVPEISNPYFGDDRRLRGRGGGAARPPGACSARTAASRCGSPATSTCWPPGPSTGCSTSGRSGPTSGWPWPSPTGCRWWSSTSRSPGCRRCPPW